MWSCAGTGKLSVPRHSSNLDNNRPTVLAVGVMVVW